jgi:hypothetical protein
VSGKMKYDMIENDIYYGYYILICGVMIIYIELKKGIEIDGKKMKDIE